MLATASTFKNISIKEDVVAIGEVGLTGEVRSVNMIEKTNQRSLSSWC